MLEILERIVEGKGEEGDIEKLEALGNSIAESALCQLGKTAPNPVLSTIRYFRDEYEVHIKEKRCPAGYCKKLLNYSILPEKCIGCGACSKVCPSSAISGVLKSPYKIDPKKCIKCGACEEKCKFGAITKK
jgi:NADP-reducing hydrogenase subunit HndC